mmetsp:Transcript_19882/g.50817  ORF Transcript_19882/g.50817 Transcript_19882/m.50817 type:complete len:81 (+) Transcript_19882:1715-1957(+)
MAVLEDVELPPLPSAGSPVTKGTGSAKKREKKRGGKGKSPRRVHASDLPPDVSVEDIINQSARYSMQSLKEVFAALDKAN